MIALEAVVAALTLLTHVKVYPAVTPAAPGGVKTVSSIVAVNEPFLDALQEVCFTATISIFGNVKTSLIVTETGLDVQFEAVCLVVSVYTPAGSVAIDVAVDVNAEGPDQANVKPT